MFHILHEGSQNMCLLTLALLDVEKISLAMLDISSRGSIFALNI